MQDFSKNLRNICAEHGSIAQVCREIGINRQQFNRYLNGTGMPSAHNLRRISRYFELPEAEFFLSLDEFTRLHLQGRKRRSSGPVDLMTGAFRDQAKTLRRYLGFYHSHFMTPTWDGMILRSLIWLYERDGFVMTRSVERVTSRDGSTDQKSKYEGLAAKHGNRIYIVEHEMVREGSIVETILTPSHRQQVKYLRGTTMGVAWRPHVMPYASRAIWKRIEDKTTAREALRACGVYALDSRYIDPTVRTHLRNSNDGGGASNSENVLT